MAYIDVKHVSKIYGSGEQEVRANDDINFEIKRENSPSLLAPPEQVSQHY